MTGPITIEMMLSQIEADPTWPYSAKEWMRERVGDIAELRHDRDAWKARAVEREAELEATFLRGSAQRERAKAAERERDEARARVAELEAETIEWSVVRRKLLGEAEELLAARAVVEAVRARFYSWTAATYGALKDALAAYDEVMKHEY